MKFSAKTKAVTTPLLVAALLAVALTVLPGMHLRASIQEGTMGSPSGLDCTNSTVQVRVITASEAKQARDNRIVWNGTVQTFGETGIRPDSSITQLSDGSVEHVDWAFAQGTFASGGSGICYKSSNPHLCFSGSRTSPPSGCSCTSSISGHYHGTVGDSEGVPILWTSDISGEGHLYKVWRNSTGTISRGALTQGSLQNLDPIDIARGNGGYIYAVVNGQRNKLFAWRSHNGKRRSDKDITISASLQMPGDSVGSKKINRAILRGHPDENGKFLYITELCDVPPEPPKEEGVPARTGSFPTCPSKGQIVIPISIGPQPVEDGRNVYYALTEKRSATHTANTVTTINPGATALSALNQLDEGYALYGNDLAGARVEANGTVSLSVSTSPSWSHPRGLATNGGTVYVSTIGGDGEFYRCSGSSCSRQRSLDGRDVIELAYHKGANKLYGIVQGDNTNLHVMRTNGQTEALIPLPANVPIPGTYDKGTIDTVQLKPFEHHLVLIVEGCDRAGPSSRDIPDPVGTLPTCPEEGYVIRSIDIGERRPVPAGSLNVAIKDGQLAQFSPSSLEPFNASGPDTYNYLQMDHHHAISGGSYYKTMLNPTNGTAELRTDTRQDHMSHPRGLAAQANSAYVSAIGGEGYIYYCSSSNRCERRGSLDGADIIEIALNSSESRLFGIGSLNFNQIIELDTQGRRKGTIALDDFLFTPFDKVTISQGQLKAFDHHLVYLAKGCREGGGDDDDDDDDPPPTSCEVTCSFSEQHNGTNSQGSGTCTSEPGDGAGSITNTITQCGTADETASGTSSTWTAGNNNLGCEAVADVTLSNGVRCNGGVSGIWNDGCDMIGPITVRQTSSEARSTGDVTPRGNVGTLAVSLSSGCSSSSTATTDGTNVQWDTTCAPNASECVITIDSPTCSTTYTHGCPGGGGDDDDDDDDDDGPRYSCVNDQCIEDANGNFPSQASCEAACGEPQECGNGEIDQGEDCDNGSVCSGNRSISCQLGQNAVCNTCMVIGGEPRCGGSPSGTLCPFGDSDCTSSSFVCEYDLAEDPSCNDDCTRITVQCGAGNTCESVASCEAAGGTPDGRVCDNAGNQCCTGGGGDDDDDDDNDDDDDDSSPRYACTNGQCIEDPNGAFGTQSGCEAECGSGTRYSCSGGSCSEDPNGAFETQTECERECGGADRFACTNNQCVVDANGPFETQTECSANCGGGDDDDDDDNDDDDDSSPRYSCNAGQCVENANGAFTTQSACEAECGNGNFSCSNNQCSADENGAFETRTECVVECNGGDDDDDDDDSSPRYACSNGQCVEDANGAFANQSSCAAECGGTDRYACTNNQCSVDANGAFETQTECNVACGGGDDDDDDDDDSAPRYSCNAGQCVENANGAFTTQSACEAECGNGNFSCTNNQCSADVNGAFETRTECVVDCNGGDDDDDDDDTQPCETNEDCGEQQCGQCAYNADLERCAQTCVVPLCEARSCVQREGIVACNSDTCPRSCTSVSECGSATCGECGLNANGCQQTCDTPICEGGFCGTVTDFADCNANQCSSGDDDDDDNNDNDDDTTGGSSGGDSGGTTGGDDLRPAGPVVYICGNGKTEGDEECDDGTENSDTEPNTCRFSCRLPSCGDSVVDWDFAEECDQGSGNGDTPDGCRSTCRLPRCGDGVQDSFEECDDGNTDDSDGCSASCALEQTDVLPGLLCGNGIVEAGEECDDGNTFDFDGCSAQCLLEQCRSNSDCGVDMECRSGTCHLTNGTFQCGNGQLDFGEECDDGNTFDFDGCSAVCLLETGFCGDGVLQRLIGEQCEPSLHSAAASFSCGPDCRFVSPTCGDGVVDDGEECDTGARNANTSDAACRIDCSLARCGDGVLDTGEQCDDGNKFSGDGCHRLCILESAVAAEFRPPAPVVSIPFPQEPAPESLGPLASILPLNLPAQAVPDTGPAALAFIASGAAAGYAWTRRRKK